MDKRAAQNHYEKAAKEGDAASAYNLSRLHKKAGADPATIIAPLRQAAASGNATAQFTLGV